MKFTSGLRVFLLFPLLANLCLANDAPVAAWLESPETYIEDTPLDLLDIVISDVDSTQVSVTLTLSDPAAGSFNTDYLYGPAPTYTFRASSDFYNGVWYANGTIEGINQLFANLVFTPSPDYFADFTLSATVTDDLGASLSGTKQFTGTEVNDPPTLDLLPDLVFAVSGASSSQIVELGSISAGFGETASLTVTATSSNPALVPNPSVHYQSPASTGFLTLSPVAGTTGSTVITVTVDEGVAQFQRTFTVSVVYPLVVTTTSPSGLGSLTAALAAAAAAPGMDLIHFSPALDGATFVFTGELAINDAGGLRIDASTLSNGLTLDGGAGTNRIFSLGSGAKLTLEGLTLTGGNGGGGNGGAILNNNGTLALSRCTFTGNSVIGGQYGPDGGAIYQNSGSLTAIACTFAGNTSGDECGAIFINSGTALLRHCTVSGNTSARNGAILYFSSLVLQDSIVYGNFSSSATKDVSSFFGTLTQIGQNFIGTTDNRGSASAANPLLSPLADNGGPTATMALAAGSPAIDAATISTALIDQRGSLIVGMPDAGAVEAETTGLLASRLDFPETYFEDTPLNLLGIAVCDVVGAQLTVTLTLSDPAAGSFNTDYLNGPAPTYTFRASSDFYNGVWTASGSVFGINQLLANLVFTPSPDYSANFTVSVTITDDLSASTSGTKQFTGIAVNDPLIVTTTSPTGSGSLTEALATAAAAPGMDLIHFSPALDGATIVLTGELAINDAGGLKIDASTLPIGLTLDGGAGTNRIFSLGSGAQLTLEGLTLTGGNGGGGNGGAILNNNGTLALSRCTFTGNSVIGGQYGPDGGAIYQNSGSLTAIACTFAGNTSGDECGAIFINSGTALLRHCTVSGNTSARNGAILYFSSLVLQDSIVYGNFSSSATKDVSSFFGTLTQIGQNFIGATDNRGSASAANPLLSPLADNGGPTATMALAAGSPAIDAATTSTGLADQRGYAVLGIPDAGAFEALPVIGVEFATGGVVGNEVTFEETIAGVPATKIYLVIRNTGVGPLVIQRIEVIGATAADFPLTTVGMLTTISPGGETSLSVGFYPSAAGLRSATLRISSNDTTRPPVESALTGNAISVLADWRMSFFGSMANSGDGANITDFEHDGLSNLLEFAFGLDPKVSDSTSLALDGLALVTRGVPVLYLAPSDRRAVFLRRKDRVAARLTYTVQFSHDLGVWFDSAEIPAVLADDGEVEMVSISYPLSLPNLSEARFFRVSVTLGTDPPN